MAQFLPQHIAWLIPAAAALAGALLAWLILRARHLAQSAALLERLAARDTEIERLRAATTELDALQIRAATLEAALDAEKNAATEKAALLDQARERLADAFKALSAEALRSNNESFLDLARTALERFQESARGDLDKRQTAIDELVKPVRETLARFDVRVGQIEKERVGAYEGLTQQVRQLGEAQARLNEETRNLVRALGTPRIRGRWGEIQLRRVVEMAGMLHYCDFQEQVAAGGANGDARLRPDLIVRLPGGKNIVVDAKAPLAAYLEAVEARDDTARAAHLADHARQLRDHVTALSRRSYWEQFEPAPEFVVLFLPGETFYGAALDADPALIETGVQQRVLIATPTTLIALLKAVAYGWRQEKLADNAREISELGRDLYKRLADLGGHFADLGERLDKAVDAYNKAVGSLETRVLVSARRFEELEAVDQSKELPDLQPVDKTARKLQARELAPKK